MTVFGRQIALAIRMIDRYGATVTWQQRGEANAGGTPAKPSGASAPVLFPNVKMVFLTNKQETLADLFSQLSPDAPDIPSGGKSALMAPVVGLEPSYNDLVRLPDNSVLMLDPKNGVRVLAPDLAPILYFLRFVA